jgi:hypothetical protein
MALLAGATLIGGTALVGTPMVAHAAGVPSAPRGVQAIGYVNAVRVGWSSPSDDGGSPVSGYRLRNAIDGTVWTVATPALDPTFLTGLPSGVALTLRVAAVNAAGTGPESSPVTVTPHSEFPGPVWKKGQDALTGRFWAQSAVLPRGRVLVIGGDVQTKSGSAPTPSAEIYDSATTTWSAVDPMPSLRTSFGLTVLRNGKVLLTGGNSDSGAPDRRAWILDPATGHWSRTGSMKVARAGHAAVLLADGTVLAAGGRYNLASRVTQTSETYDPATGTWTLAGSMLHPRTRGLAVRLAERNGRVLYAGGTAGHHGQRYAELYRPSTRTWAATGSMVVARNHDDAGEASVTLLNDGRVLVAGGYRYGPTPQTTGPQRTAEIYTPSTGTWAATSTMPFATTAGHRAVLLPSGLVVVAGGQDTFGSLAVVQGFNPTTGKWARLNDLNGDREYPIAAPLSGGRILVATGLRITPETILQDSEIYWP